MNKINKALLILAIFSTTALTGYALPSDMDANISANKTIANPVNTADAIEISETANVINITENSNETTIIESIIKEDQKKSSPGFGLADTALITLIILTTVIVNIRNNRKIRR
jgi:hypothetical protein